MPKLFISLVSYFLFWGIASSSDVTEVDLSSVIIYPSAAKVQKEADVYLDSGDNYIVIHYLPQDIDANSIKIGLLNNDSVHIGDTVFKSETKAVDLHPEYIAEQEKLKELMDETVQFNQQIRLLNARAEYARDIMNSFSSTYGKKDGALPSGENIDQIWEFYEKTIIDTDKQKEEYQLKLKPLKKDIKKQKEKLERITLRLNRLTNSVQILLRSETAQNIKLKLSYLVYGCSWRPFYEVQASPDSDKIGIRYQAIVRQNTGENWNNVQVALSTADVRSNQTLPELYPIRLNKIEPVSNRMRSMKMETMDMDAEEEVMTLGGALAAAPAPEVETSYTSFVVNLPASLTLLSGVEENKVVIFDQQFDAEFWNEVVPSISETAYLMSKIKNQFELPILSGQAILNVDGQMIGKSYVQETHVGDDVIFSLGENESIFVTKKIGKLNQSDKGVFGKSRQLVRQYFYELRNTGKRTVAVRVKDQFPISENEKIVVKGISPSQNDADFEENTGVFTWKTQLKADESVEYETKFEVSFPQEWNIPLYF